LAQFFNEGCQKGTETSKSLLLQIFLLISSKVLTTDKNSIETETNEMEKKKNSLQCEEIINDRIMAGVKITQQIALILTK
jgi:hypothetical protein